MKVNLTHRLKYKFSTSSRCHIAEDTKDERFYTPRAQASSARSVKSHDGTSTIPKNLKSDDCSRSSFSSLSSSASIPSKFETNTQMHEKKILMYHRQAKYRSFSDSVRRVNKENDLPPFHQKILKNSDISKRRSFISNDSSTYNGSSSSAHSFPRPSTCTNNYSDEIFSFARHGKLEAVASLLSQGVAVDSPDENGNTILSIACQNGNKRILKSALRHGANVNSQNNRGNTALHFCYRYGFAATLGAYLIQNGADPLIRNKEGRSCVDEFQARKIVEY